MAEDEGIIAPPGGVPAIPQNELLVAGSASSRDGAEIHGSFGRTKGSVSGGVEGGVGQKSGWRIGGFFRKVWGA